MTANFKMNKWVETSIVAVAILAPTIAAVYFCKLYLGAEFSPFYAISRLIKAGAYSQIYNANVIQGMEKTLVPTMHVNSFFLVPPIASWAVYPLALLKYQQAFYAWVFLSAISVFYAFMMLCRYFNLRGTKRAWAAVLLGSLGPLTICLSKGYATPLLLLAMIGLLINLKKKNFLMASVFQSLFWIQPQIILPLLCFEFGIGQFYTVIITVLLAIIGLLISFLASSFGIAHSWYDLYVQQMHNWAASLANCTLQGQLLRFSVAKEAAGYIALAVYFAFVVSAYYIGRLVKKKQWQLNVFFSGLIPLSLLLSLRSASHDLLLLYPGIITLMLMPLNGWWKYLRAIVVMLSLSLLLLPLNILFSSNVTESNVFNPFFWLLFFFSATALAIEHYAKRAPPAARE